MIQFGLAICGSIPVGIPVGIAAIPVFQGAMPSGNLGFIKRWFINKAIPTHMAHMARRITSLEISNRLPGLVNCHITMV